MSHKQQTVNSRGGKTHPGTNAGKGDEKPSLIHVAKKGKPHDAATHE